MLKKMEKKMFKNIIVNRDDFSWRIANKAPKNCKGNFKVSRIPIEKYLIRHVSIAITNNCNLSCPYCYKAIHKDKKLNEIPLNTILKFVDKLLLVNINGNKMETLQLIGGEPTLHSNFLDICNYLLEKGIGVRISTNGSTPILHSQEMLSFSKNKNIEFRISLDSSEIYKNIKTRGNSYNKVIENIKYLVANNINVSVKSVITKENIFDIKKMLEFLKELKVADFSYSPLYKLGNIENGDYYNKFYVSDNTIYKALIKINEQDQDLISMLKANIISHTLEKIFLRNPRYLFSKFYIYIDYNGNIYPQDQLTFPEFLIGNIYDKNLDIDKICKKMLFLKNKHEINKKSCINCDFVPFCPKGNYGELYSIDPTLESSFPNCSDLKMLMFEMMNNSEESINFLKNIFL